MLTLWSSPEVEADRWKFIAVRKGYKLTVNLSISVCDSAVQMEKKTLPEIRQRQVALREGTVLYSSSLSEQIKVKQVSQKDVGKIKPKKMRIVCKEKEKIILRK